MPHANLCNISTDSKVSFGKKKKLHHCRANSVFAQLV